MHSEVSTGAAAEALATTFPKPAVCQLEAERAASGDPHCPYDFGFRGARITTERIGTFSGMLARARIRAPSLRAPSSPNRFSNLALESSG
ncbi:hypothetical protein AAFF_G00275070 [Aldrovandia affinis]|uniref:Uncharacterized protein n=1 Tax=Aldrovandia affinis TaxID=143900 RepID=A0AAD7SS63_9TELE|nr:hypothetical protein AAFF_G00275070 [Aldrovandia affinis]